MKTLIQTLFLLLFIPIYSQAYISPEKAVDLALEGELQVVGHSKFLMDQTQSCVFRNKNVTVIHGYCARRFESPAASVYILVPGQGVIGLYVEGNVNPTKADHLCRYSSSPTDPCHFGAEAYFFPYEVSGVQSMNLKEITQLEFKDGGSCFSIFGEGKKQSNYCYEYSPEQGEEVLFRSLSSYFPNHMNQWLELLHQLEKMRKIARK